MATDSACFVIVQVFAGILRLLSLSRQSLKGCHQPQNINMSISAKNKHTPPGIFHVILGSTDNVDLSMVGSAAF